MGSSDEETDEMMSQLTKKTKGIGGSAIDAKKAQLIPDPVYEEIRSAISIKKVLDSINELQPLGYCPTKVQKFRENLGLDDMDDLHDENSTYPDGTENLEEIIRTRDLANQVCKYVNPICCASQRFFPCWVGDP